MNDCADPLHLLFLYTNKVYSTLLQKMHPKGGKITGYSHNQCKRLASGCIFDKIRSKSVVSGFERVVHVP